MSKDDNKTAPEEQPNAISIPLTEPRKKFKEHITIPNNKRIFFSGQFGSGKTFFLEDYFDKKKQNEYNVIHLYPVNYSVASNEDIFEILKYEILYNLFSNFEVDTGGEVFDELITFQSFLINNPTDILKAVFKNFTKIGKTYVEILEKYNEHKEEFKETIEDKIDAFDNFVKNKKGLFESDPITNTIKELVKQLKTNDKETVLIIDDLDRVDPEHIFRLLNVFAAQVDADSKTHENKFGFDRVILVADIENIRSIFTAKYGAKTDFTGYIDKFYSNTIFNFDNKKAILDNIKTIIFNLKLYHPDVEENYFFNWNESNPLYLDLRDILYLAVDRNIIKIRDLTRFNNQRISLTRRDEVRLTNGIDIKIYKLSTLLMFEILFQLLDKAYKGGKKIGELIRQIDDGMLTGDRSFKIGELLLILTRTKIYQEKPGVYDSNAGKLNISVRDDSTVAVKASNNLLSNNIPNLYSRVFDHLTNNINYFR